MNVETGHLVADAELKQMPVERQRRYTRVPKRLAQDAKRMLARGVPAHVDLGGGTKLAEWARKERAAAKRKRKTLKRARQQQRRRSK